MQLCSKISPETRNLSKSKQKNHIHNFIYRMYRLVYLLKCIKISIHFNEYTDRMSTIGLFSGTISKSSKMTQCRIKL